MKIVTLLSGILSTWTFPVRYEQIIHADVTIHFYTVTNGKYEYNGVGNISLDAPVWDRERVIAQVMIWCRSEAREIVIISDYLDRGFIWNPKREGGTELLPVYR